MKLDIIFPVWFVVIPGPCNAMLIFPEDGRSLIH